MKRTPVMFPDDIISAVESVFAFTDGYDLDRFTKEDKTQSAVIRKMEIIGEAVKRLPAGIISAHRDVPWSYMAKMRDKLIHGYFGVDAEIIWKVVTERFPQILPLLTEIRKELMNAEESKTDRV